jgi:hypothetical protein
VDHRNGERRNQPNDRRGSDRLLQRRIAAHRCASLAQKRLQCQLPEERTQLHATIACPRAFDSERCWDFGSRCVDEPEADVLVGSSNEGARGRCACAATVVDATLANLSPRIDLPGLAALAISPAPIRVRSIGGGCWGIKSAAQSGRASKGRRNSRQLNSP